MGNEHGYWRQMVRLYCRAGRPELALEKMKKDFARVSNSWEVNSWLGTMRSHCGEYAALNAAGQLGELGGVRRLGAGEYLVSYSGTREAARPLLEAAASDGGLSVELRFQALDRLMNIARGNSERAELARPELARRRVALGGSYWQRARSYQNLARWLARCGRVKDGVDAVRSADKVRSRHSNAGPRTLSYLGSYLFHGSRVGPGLRTAEGLAEAEKAAEGLYREFSGRREYLGYFSAFLGQLAELHARRGDYDGAVKFLHGLCAVKNTSFLRLKAAALLDRRDAEKKEKPDVLAEYLAYADVAAAEHAAELRRRSKYRRYWLPGIDGSFSTFLEKNGKDGEFLKHADARLRKLDGLDRDASAQQVIQFLRNRGKPEEVKEYLAKVRALGVKGTFYDQQMQWAVAAIRMKNSKSRADTVRRDRLLKEVERWKSTMAKNPEDYGAALNTYKVYQLLGRQNDADPHLERALKISSKDPLIMERYARELMLEKSYAGAAKMMMEAAKISGRRTDYEQQMVSAFALAGKGQDALDLALDSLVEGRHGGRGVRTVEQILDMAHRANKEKFLHGAIKKVVAGAAAGKKPLPDEVVRLALRVAWDRADAELSSAAVDELVRIVRDPARHWRQHWRLENLAQKAQERRRLKESARIRAAILELNEARGHAPNLHSYRQLAMLMIEASEPAGAAELMFDGLARAGQGTPQHRPIPVPWERRRRRPGVLDGVKGIAPDPGPGPVPQPRQVRLPWIAAIVEMAAMEKLSGGEDFAKACGKRLEDLVGKEMKVLAASPAGYAGPLVRADVEEALGLRGKVTAAFRKAAAAEKAAERDHLALAGRLVNLAVLPPEKRPKGITLAEIASACDAAVKAAAKAERAKAHLAAGRFFQRLLGVKEEHRIKGLKPEAALKHFEAAAEGSGRWG
ncbi:MAG: tetratricopeptide repeat protein, partial [Planctomycetota bacterium]